MTIEAVELRAVEIPLRVPFETSFGRRDTKTGILVRVRADGLDGWGEAPADDPYYNEESLGTAWHILDAYLIPTVLGHALAHPTAFTRLAHRVRRNHIAKCGLESALWDLHAQREGVSLARALGGVRDRIEVGVSLGIEPELPPLLDRVAAFLERGYRRIKVKIKPGWDVEVVRAVRDRFGEIALQVDANSAYTLDDLPTLRTLDREGLLLIEQPLGEDDIVDHARLQRELRTPICLDESIVNPDDARKALELGSCRVINIKPSRLGGPAAAAAVHDLCAARDVPVWCGGMLETGIGRLHNVALASLPNFRLPGDVSASDRYFAEDVIEPPVVLDLDGTVAVPQGVGLGAAVLLDRVDRYTVRSAVHLA